MKQYKGYMTIEILGFIAGTLTTFAFIPQVTKIVKTNDTSGISMAFAIAFNVGVMLWLIYGIIVESSTIIASNAVVLFLSLIIFSYKVKNIVVKKEKF